MPDSSSDKSKTGSTTNNLLEAISWNEKGLLPVIAQDQASGQVLMMAWMNAEALRQTINCGEAVYWSRSRQKLWHKGESSGHVQIIKEMRLDCDGDTMLLMVEQRGGIACHTGRAHCFFQKRNTVNNWETIEPVLKDPKAIYEK